MEKWNIQDRNSRIHKIIIGLTEMSLKALSPEEDKNAEFLLPLQQRIPGVTTFVFIFDEMKQSAITGKGGSR
ncbi:hypothetical protein Tco_0290069 [Tanacetum coccineum]